MAVRHSPKIQIRRNDSRLGSDHHVVPARVNAPRSNAAVHVDTQPVGREPDRSDQPIGYCYVGPSSQLHDWTMHVVATEPELD